jgi:hypothetical protein
MEENEVVSRIEERKKLGSVASSSWQAYTWKNELNEQNRRIAQLLEDALTDAATEHNPYHMLERAIGVAAICMRRLIECRLVTDLFRESKLEVHEVSVKANVNWREPFVTETVGDVFNNYDLTSRRSKGRTPEMISNKMLHARVIGVLSASEYLPNGLLIASDTQRKNHLFHFMPSEISNVFEAFLKDEVRHAEDGYLNPDGSFDGLQKVYAIRK